MYWNCFASGRIINKMQFFLGGGMDAELHERWYDNTLCVFYGMRRSFYIWIYLLVFLVLMLSLSTQSCSISRVSETTIITKQLFFFRFLFFLILILKSTRKLLDFNVLLQELKLYCSCTYLPLRKCLQILWKWFFSTPFPFPPLIAEA